MRRREFITLLGGVAAWPLAARAQQPVPVIDFLHSASADAFVRQVAVFQQGLRDNGYVEGQNLVIEYRWADGRSDRLATLAADLVRRDVAVIAALGGNNPTLAARAATRTIPIVFNTGADPVRSGLVPSLSRPGGNVTGVSFLVEELGAKTLGLLHELVPKAMVIGVLINPSNPEAERETMMMQEAARTLGLRLEIIRSATANEIDNAFPILLERRVGALIVIADPFFGSRTAQLVELAARDRIPTAYYRREYAEAGGLMSYGTSANEAYRQVGNYVARILKGTKPAELPVYQVVKFEFLINLKTAKALGLEVPPGLSARADEVIE
ncbi:MAG: ABC transporter substrate-binding protein [Xanthobacteraceae bacterium]|jgi:putative ABC transport system substrate-binding protein